MPDYEKAWEAVEPLIRAIAEYERDNGTIAVILPSERETFCKIIEETGKDSACRAAVEYADQ